MASPGLKLLEDLKAEATTQDGFDQQAYNKLKALADKLHEPKLKNIREQQKASGNANESGSRPTSPNAPAPTPSTPQPTKSAGVSVVVNNPTFLSGSPKEANDFIRMVKRGLDELANRSRDTAKKEHRVAFSLSFGYDQLNERVASVCVDEVPAGSSIQSTCQQMAKELPEPYLLFYLRWSGRLTEQE